MQRLKTKAMLTVISFLIFGIPPTIFREYYYMNYLLESIYCQIYLRPWKSEIRVFDLTSWFVVLPEHDAFDVVLLEILPDPFKCPRHINNIYAVRYYDLTALEDEVDGLLKKIPLYDDASDGYIHSSWVIFRKSKETLEKHDMHIRQLIKKFKMLKTVYDRIFRIDMFSRLC